MPAPGSASTLAATHVEISSPGFARMCEATRTPAHHQRGEIARALRRSGLWQLDLRPTWRSKRAMERLDDALPLRRVLLPRRVTDIDQVINVLAQLRKVRHAFRIMEAHAPARDSDPLAGVLRADVRGCHLQNCLAHA
jgi:hypothetical protein